MQKTFMLKKNYEFRKVLTKGRYYSGKYIELFAIKNHKEYNRIGIAIGVKIAKAVKRNYVKRLIRENYRKIEEKIDVGYDIVFLWKKKVDIKEANYYKIEKDINKIFYQMGILK